MLAVARDRLARTLRGDAQPAFSVELTARRDDLSLVVEGFGLDRAGNGPGGSSKTSARQPPVVLTG